MICEIMGGNIELNFQATSPDGHYVQTPYNYTPKLGRRLIRSTYIDLGLGLLDCLQHIDNAVHPKDYPAVEASRGPR
jgi:UDP-glucose 4-epimerase